MADTAGLSVRDKIQSFRRVNSIFDFQGQPLISERDASGIEKFANSRLHVVALVMLATQNAALHSLEFAYFIASRASASTASQTSSRISPARGCSISVITYTVTVRMSAKASRCSQSLPVDVAMSWPAISALPSMRKKIIAKIINGSAITPRRCAWTLYRSSHSARL